MEVFYEDVLATTTTSPLRTCEEPDCTTLYIKNDSIEDINTVAHVDITATLILYPNV